MNRKYIVLTIAAVFLAVSAGFAAENGTPVPTETPYQALEKSRALEAAPAVQLLEGKISASGELRPFYLLELAERTASLGDWKKTLEWSRQQDLPSLPETVADRVYYWFGESLVRTGDAASAASLYLARLESGKTLDPLLYLAYFRIGQAKAEKLTARLDSLLPSLKNTDPATFALSRYLGGLCAVRSGEWNFASQSFARFSSAYESRFPEYAPWSRFYLGWSYYRLGRWTDAVREFSVYLDTWKNHDRSWQAATAAALAAMQAGSDPLLFAERAVRLAPTNDDLAGSVLLEASVLADRKQFSRSEALLSGVADGSATSGLTSSAPRALFMLGDLAARQGKSDAAEERWLAVSARFPKDPLAEESLFRAGDQWYIAGEWVHATALFARYRQSWPSGRFLDTVLRLGGDAYNRQGNADLAILWWEELLRKYPSSSAFPRAAADLVAAYRAKGEYGSALRTAETYLSRFPTEAKIDGMDSEADELKKLKNGETLDTAALLSSYAKAGRASTADGRVAGLTLARRYLADYSRRGDALSILGEIAAKAPKSPNALSVSERSTYAAVLNLLGNMDREDGKYSAASAMLLSAGNFYAAIDGERSAEALYGAADSFMQAGLRSDASKTVETMKKTWPDSSWTRRASILINSPVTEQ